MVAGARGTLLVALLALAGCPNTPFTTCDDQPDLTGRWLLAFAPGGEAPIPRATTVEADLRQVRRQSGIGSLVWGTLTAADKGFFDVLHIPELMQNNGSKTGGVLGCRLRINVPVTAAVTDDDADNGPLRLSLSGSIPGRGMLMGDADVSTVIRIEDRQMRLGTFTWTGALH
jgi:hypothetical protein